MTIEKIPFNTPYIAGGEVDYIREVFLGRQFAGDGGFTEQCHKWLEANLGSQKALLTHSCTSALEMAALLIDIKPGDEVIVPSYTFVSTANAFVLRGGVPVFVDIRTDTLNIDESKIEAAITERTRAIVPVHYAGVACDMDSIMKIARQYCLKVIEDAAQGVMASYKKIPLGRIGDLGTLSFHETKNVISGEGGALLINRDEYIIQAEIIREKGTDRSRFFRGELDKYTWQAVGSSFLPSELTAAFLSAQLEHATKITEQRRKIWDQYNLLTESLEQDGLLRRPQVPDECEHNAHMFYILLTSGVDSKRLLADLKANGIQALSHYVPLHSSPGGRRFGRIHAEMKNTNQVSERIVRLPLWIGLNASDQERVVNSLQSAIKSQGCDIN